MRGGHLPNLKWAHRFYAGVDVIASLLRTCAEQDSAEQWTRRLLLLARRVGNLSAMRFIKQIPRCMENKRERKWDKFVMGGLEERTLGLVGAGSIALTARLARPSGCASSPYAATRARRRTLAPLTSCSARTMAAATRMESAV